MIHKSQGQAGPSPGASNPGLVKGSTLGNQEQSSPSNTAKEHKSSGGPSHRAETKGRPAAAAAAWKSPSCSPWYSHACSLEKITRPSQVGMHTQKRTNICTATETLLHVHGRFSDVYDTQKGTETPKGQMLFSDAVWMPTGRCVHMTTDTDVARHAPMWTHQYRPTCTDPEGDVPMDIHR